MDTHRRRQRLEIIADTHDDTIPETTGLVGLAIFLLASAGALVCLARVVPDILGAMLMLLAVGMGGVGLIGMVFVPLLAWQYADRAIVRWRLRRMARARPCT